MSATRRALDEAREERRQLKERCGSAEKAIEEWSDLQCTEFELAKQERAALAEDVASEREQHKVELDALKTQIAALQGTMQADELRRDIATARKQAVEQRVRAKSLEREKVALWEENEQLKKALQEGSPAGLHFGLTTASSEDTKSIATYAIHAARAVAEELSAHTTKGSTKQPQRNQLEAKVSRLSAELDSTKAAFLASQLECNELRRTLASLQTTCDQTNNVSSSSTEEPSTDFQHELLRTLLDVRHSLRAKCLECSMLEEALHQMARHLDTEGDNSELPDGATVALAQLAQRYVALEHQTVRLAAFAKTAHRQLVKRGHGTCESSSEEEVFGDTSTWDDVAMAAPTPASLDVLLAARYGEARTIPRSRSPSSPTSSMRHHLITRRSSMSPRRLIDTILPDVANDVAPSDDEGVAAFVEQLVGVKAGCSEVKSKGTVPLTSLGEVELQETFQLNSVSFTLIHHENRD